MTWDPKYDIYKDFAQTEDEELILWEQWIQIRRDEVIKLMVNLDRSPVDLVMHRLEWKRADKERKRALEEAQVAMKPVVEDSLYAKKTRLKQRCPCEPVYQIHQTALDRHQPRVVQHVGCSDYIKQHELGLFGQPERVSCSKINAEYVNYREQREKTLQKEIEKIDPCRPDMCELVVIGRRPRTPPPKIPPLPTIVITEPIETCADVLSAVCAIRVNDTVVYKNIPKQSLRPLKNMQKENWHEFCHSWTYYFNVPEKKMGRSKLELKNLGTVTLRYCWKKTKKSIPFIPEDIYEPTFYFYKNEDVLSPGQSKTLYFTFVSETAGIYSESWELCLMNVSLFESTADKFMIHLIGDAVENMKKTMKKTEKLQNRIDRKATEKFVDKLLKKVIADVTSVTPQICPYRKFLLEADLFELRNPVCYYHQTEVQRMKQLYSEMTGSEWDLTIASWRDALIRKEFEERMVYFECLKSSHSVLLKPWGERENIAEQKFRTVKLLFGQLLDKFDFERHRIDEWNGNESQAAGGGREAGDQRSRLVLRCPMQQNALTPHITRNIFYMRMSGHVAAFLETIAGVISSIEKNRWIQFDFCQ